jgi:hypothetical protein
VIRSGEPNGFETLMLLKCCEGEGRSPGRAKADLETASTRSRQGSIAEPWPAFPSASQIRRGTHSAGFCLGGNGALGGQGTRMASRTGNSRNGKQ